MTQDMIDFKLLRHVHNRAIGYVPLEARQHMSEFIADHINRLIGKPPAATEPYSHFARDGVIQFGNVLTNPQISEIISYFKDFAVFDGHTLMHSDRIPRNWNDLRQYAHYASYQRSTVIRAPYLMELANHPSIISLAAAHLGCWPTLYSLHAWWSFGGRPIPARYAQTFHRDLDDYRFCTLFIYLTDVNVDGGPHQYITTSHRVDGVRKMLAEAANYDPSVSIKNPEDYFSEGYGQDDVFHRIFNKNIVTITGEAGHGFLADTTGLHRGLPPTKHNRLIFWARYGLLPNSLIDEDWFSPVPANELPYALPTDSITKYINRCQVI